MRYLTWIRSAREQGEPPQALQDAMNAAIEEQMKAGVILEAGGLGTIRDGGAKLTLTNGKITDGPYAETKELVGGYAIQNLSSHEEALDNARWLLDLHKEYWPEWEGDVEVRQMYVDGESS
ncbi:MULTISPECIES: YciI family protein [Antrihabitans]|uniref:YCII-related domain-containing protein n=2 Tax=Antrihabitans TaxID=2799491 RepID=A0A934NPA0_9NOCA|nr:YciI family protein [Antrihabitans stalagmiti]MBJ8338889.1 hypothetical protein [Antrihabitans stalagmiti]